MDQSIYYRFLMRSFRDQNVIFYQNVETAIALKWKVLKVEHKMC